jgi:hypothetical protein
MLSAVEAGGMVVFCLGLLRVNQWASTEAGPVGLKTAGMPWRSSRGGPDVGRDPPPGPPLTRELSGLFGTVIVALTDRHLRRWHVFLGELSRPARPSASASTAPRLSSDTAPSIKCVGGAARVMTPAGCAGGHGMRNEPPRAPGGGPGLPGAEHPEIVGVGALQ